MHIQSINRIRKREGESIYNPSIGSERERERERETMHVVVEVARKRPSRVFTREVNGNNHNLRTFTCTNCMARYMEEVYPTSEEYVPHTKKI